MIADSPKLAHKFEALHIFFCGKIGDPSLGEGGGGGTHGQFGWRCAAVD